MFLNQSPVFRLLLPFLFGVVAMICYPFPAIYAVALLLLLTAIYIVVQFIPAVAASRKFRWLIGSLINGLFFLLGCIITWLHCDLSNNLHFSTSSGQFYYAVVTEPPVFKEKTVKVIAEIQSVKEGSELRNATGKLLIYIPNTGDVKLRYGQCFIFKANPQRIAAPKNPEEFNYARYLAFHNIFHQAYLQSNNYRIVNSQNRNILYSTSFQLREYLVTILKETIHDKEIYSVGSALLVGFEDDLEGPLMNAYATSGTLHVLSVSGMHVAVIYKVLEWLLRFLLKRRGGRHLYFAIILSFIWFYAFLTGLSPSVLRAAMMLNFVIVGKWSGRNTGVLNTLAVSCFLLVIYNPFLITEVGFQLSFLAVFGIVFLHPLLFRLYEAPNRFLYALWSIISVSLCAQLITFPLGLFYFHQFPNFFLLANILVIPATTAAIYACIALVILYQVPLLGMIIAKLCYAFIWFSNEVVKMIDTFPYAVVNGVSINLFEMILIYIMIILGIVYLMYKRWISLLQFMFLLIVFQGMQLVENISFRQQKVMVIYALKKHYAIGFVEGSQCYLVADDKLQKDKNTVQFHLSQHWWKLGIENTSFMTGDFNNASLIKINNGIQFNDTRIIIVDSLYATQLKKQKVSQPLKVDYLVLSGNPGISLKKLSYCFKYKKLIIDDSNANSKVKWWTREAINLKVDYHCIGEQGAFIQEFKN